VFLTLVWLLAFRTALAQATTYALGTTALLEGPAAGSDSVVLAVTPGTGVWTATANATWLHLSPTNQSGAGSTIVVFSYDANPGATRTGTLTISGQTLTVTQAGSTYVAAGPVTTLATSGLHQPSYVAVDGAGNVYISGGSDAAVDKWTATNNTVTTLLFYGYYYQFGPAGVAVDGAGNLYIADAGIQGITKWTAASNGLTTLVTGLSYPTGIALDGAGNVYVADYGNNAIKEWILASNTVNTLVSSGLHWPNGVAVDVAGNVYIADPSNPSIQEWTAANGTVTQLVTQVSYSGSGAVDGAGNVYWTDSGNNAIEKWTAAGNTVTTLVTGLSYPTGIALDGAGNAYILDFYPPALLELPYAFVDPTTRMESGAASNDALPVVLPATANLLAPFTPTSDQPWLTISGITNGVVSFCFAANTGPSRTAHITLLGQTVPVTQGVILTPPTLTGWTMLGNGVFQFAFSNNQGASFTVLSTTNLSLPLTNWSVIGAPTNISPGLFQFTSQPTTNDPQRFYRISSP
jgi:sugar lactone lactonase YvrE